MNYRLVIQDSWRFTQRNKRLITWYGFFPALLTTLVGILYFGYQIIATMKSPYFSGKEDKSFLREIIEAIITFLKENPTPGFILFGIAIFIGLLYLFIPTLFQGGLIQLSARLMNRQDVRIRDGITYGLFSFLPLFEYHLMIKGIGFITIVVEGAFILRNLGVEWLKTLLIPLIFFALLGLFLTLLFTYAEYFIVIDKTPVFQSILKSSKLVLFHWQETFLILILMLIITIRIIFNIILVLLIPALILIPAGFIAAKTLAVIGVIIGIVIGIIALFFAAYFGGILEVFKTAVWVQTFLRLTNQEEISAREKNVGPAHPPPLGARDNVE